MCTIDWSLVIEYDGKIKVYILLITEKSSTRNTHTHTQKTTTKQKNTNNNSRRSVERNFSSFTVVTER